MQKCYIHSLFVGIFKKQTPPSCAGSLGICRDSFKYTLLSFSEEEVTFKGKNMEPTFFFLIALLRQPGLWCGLPLSGQNWVIITRKEPNPALSQHPQTAQAPRFSTDQSAENALGQEHPINPTMKQFQRGLMPGMEDRHWHGAEKSALHMTF